MECQPEDEQDQKPKQPRQKWDDYFYDIAKKVALRSHDDSKVGAVLVRELDNEHIIIATGYNGFPRNVIDDPSRFGDKEKLCWTVHAEINTLCNAARVGVSTNRTTIYVTKFPCSQCAGALIQFGIRRVYTLGKAWEKDPNGDKGERSFRMLAEAGVITYAPKIEMKLILEEERVKSADTNGAKSNGHKKTKPVSK